MFKDPKKNISTIIKKWEECLSSEDSDKQVLVEHIIKFLQSARGNAALLAKETGINRSIISHLSDTTKPLPSLERLIVLAKASIKLENSKL
ncbi:hypothetical protein LEP1GSC168_0024 [Leptospira santarosai str. HAI134]|nr:hypothetical protein LEP1GSC168_0024 [Leptospira santarosai str. HAI134]